MTESATTEQESPLSFRPMPLLTPVTPAVRGASMTRIRACTPADIPRVAELFQAVFRDSPGPAPASLQQHLLDLFFRTPWHDPELPSLVYVASGGTVGGFVGVIPLKMSLHGRPVRVALASSIMVEKPKAHPLVGAGLLRAFLNGPQELSISDDANQTSVVMWKKLGGRSVPLESMAWLRVLRPAGFAFSTVADRIPWLRVARPVGSAIDSIAVRVGLDPFRLKSRPVARSIEVGLHDESLIRHLREFAADYSLGPDWDNDSLRWLLNQAAENRRRGHLVAIAVYGKAAHPLGCCLYYSRPNGVAHVLQVMSSPESAGLVVDSLLEHAHQNRCVAVRGRAHSRYIDALFSRGCFFFNRGSVVVHSRRADIVEAARSGDALMIGLAGEAWTRIAGGDVFD